jgi:mono/diheme cytochrome c family protein
VIRLSHLGGKDENSSGVEAMGLRLAPAFLLAATLGMGTTRPAAADEKKSSAKSAPAGFSQEVAPLLAKYCATCHGGDKPKAHLAFDAFKDEASALRDPDVWEKVSKKLRAGEMPPEKKPKPSKEEVNRITSWIDVKLAQLHEKNKKDPGRVTLRRLNRVEYNNTIRDLVGIDFHPADDFPSDDVGYGFDNIGDVLSMAPILMEKYVEAAERIVDKAWQSPDLRRRIMICQPTEKTKIDCARKILENFAFRAYRRPLKGDEVDRLVGFVTQVEAQGDSFERGIQLGLQAVLVSPHFLFRIELDPQPNKPDAVHLVNDFELASRLSYFLWSSMPDDELFQLAKQGTLHQEGNLENQVRRMLKDPKARALVDNFAGQWLQLRSLKNAAPDPGLFPAFDEALRSAMLKESALFFEAVMREDRSILDFLDADFTFVNERLARHYGLPGIKGNEFQRVSLTGDQRGGILTQASILTVTSNPTRTSPVKRGKWILENILGTPPPPPPPDVPELKEGKELTGTLRQRMEQHRANPNCATCHQRLDPLGFGFENYDSIGAWRTKDGQAPIDPSGSLPDGRSFKGPKELKAILKGKEEEFRRCLAEKMLTYALGRGLEYFDKPAIEQISQDLAKNGNRFSALVIAIVKSDPFQKRRGKRG